MYNFIATDFPAENPRAELMPVLFSKLVAEIRNEIIHNPLCTIKKKLNGTTKIPRNIYSNTGKY